MLAPMVDGVADRTTVPYLVFDTNAVFNDWMLAGKLWLSIFDFVRCGRLHLCVPELVIQEIVRVHAREASSVATLLVKLDSRKVRTLLDLDLPDATEIKYRAAVASGRYEADLRARLDEIGARILPIPTIDHQEIVSRALAGRQPFDQEGKNGYRDTLIWHTILSLCEELDENELVIFITANTADFCNRKNPKIFSPELSDNVAALEKAPQLRHYESMRTMFENKAEHIGELEDEHLGRGELSEEENQRFCARLVVAISAACDALYGVEVATTADGYPHQSGLDFSEFHTPFEEPISVQGILPNLGSISWEFVGLDFDETMTFTVSVEADIELDGMIYKADWYVLDDDSVTVIDSDWNKHYVYAAKECAGTLIFLVAAHKSLDVIERVDFRSAMPDDNIN